MKKILFIALLTLLTIAVNAQLTTTPTIKPTDTAKLYNPAADAKADIANAVKRAGAEHKNVFL